MRRSLTKLVVFLLLGAIVNVAVAWGCAAWSELRFTIYRDPPDYVSRVWRHDFGDEAYDGFDRHSFDRRRGVGVRWDRFWVFQRDRGEGMWRSFYQMGWPDHAVEGWHEVMGLEELATRWALDTGIWVGSGDSGRPLILALRPSWPGFAVNTIFYAVILWLPFAPFQLRRYVRVKRGHCIKCGYDLRGSSGGGCPECGWRREDVP